MSIIDYLKFFIARSILAIIPPALPYADEFWQGPEVAHRDVFGYGHLTWEWTRSQPLRSPVYHYSFTLYYYVLYYLNMDYQFLVAYGPRMYFLKQQQHQLVSNAHIQLFMIYIYQDQPIIKDQQIEDKLVKNIINYTLWFSLTCFSKTIINSFETTLFTMALYYWQSRRQKNNEIKCRILVIISMIARPSSMIPWIFIWPFELLTTKFEWSIKIRILIKNFLTLFVFVISSILIDSIYHKKLTSTFYNFLEFNFLSGMSDFYGVHSKLWFFYACIPFIIFGWIFCLLIGLVHSVKIRRHLDLLGYGLFYLFVLSLSRHKEDRFLLPLFPIFIILIAQGIKCIEGQQEKITKLRKIFKKFLIYFAIMTNLLFFIAINTHQDVGAFKTMNIIKQWNATSVQFFTQCHRTPFYSYIHQNIPMYFPDCSPTHNQLELETYQLQRDPLHYLQQHPLNSSHIIIYSYLLNDQVNQYILQQGYKKIADIYHQQKIDTYFQDQYDVRFIVYAHI